MTGIEDVQYVPGMRFVFLQMAESLTLENCCLRVPKRTTAQQFRNAKNSESHSHGTFPDQDIRVYYTCQEESDYIRMPLSGKGIMDCGKPSRNGCCGFSMPAS